MEEFPAIDTAPTPGRKLQAPLVAFYSIYNDGGLLPRSVASVEPYVDEIFFLDGIYAGFPSKPPVSDDGSREYITTIKKGAYHVASGYPQHEKRNMMFKLAPSDAWILAIDGDEVLHNGHLLRDVLGELTDDIGSVFFINSSKWFARLFRNRPGIEYFSHISMKHDGKITPIVNCLGERLPQSICINNLKVLRPEERKHQKWLYYQTNRLR